MPPDPSVLTAARSPSGVVNWGQPLLTLPSQSPLALDIQRPQAASSTQLSSVTQWYRNDGTQGWLQPAEDAYQEALAILKKELTAEELVAVGIFSTATNSIRDVQSSISQALTQYETRERESKVRTWLTRCALRIKHYEGVFDTLAQYQPEFTSFAWGTLKFLVIAIINHEEVLAEVSKAIARIGDVLPRTELHSTLYPTERMREAVSHVYASILQFAVASIRWFKMGRLKHSLVAVVRPFKMTFAPLVEEIADKSRLVDQLASAMAKAEIRDQHTAIMAQSGKIERLEQRLGDIVNMFMINNATQTEILLDLRSQRSFFQTSQVEDIRHLMLTEGVLDNLDSLAHCQSLRRRRLRASPSQIPPRQIWLLKNWLEDTSSAASSSSILLAESSRGVRTSSVDFAVDFLAAVREKGVPVVWALPLAASLSPSSTWPLPTRETPSNATHHRSPASGDTYGNQNKNEYESDFAQGGRESKSLSSRRDSRTLSAVIRSLILQVLELEPVGRETLTRGQYPMTINQLRRARSLAEWLVLLRQCLCAAAFSILVVVDLGLIRGVIADAARRDPPARDDGETDGTMEFVRCLSDAVISRNKKQQQTSGSLKILVTSTKLDELMAAEMNDIFGDRRMATDQGLRTARLMAQPKFRGVYRHRTKTVMEGIRRAVEEISVDGGAPSSSI